MSGGLLDCSATGILVGNCSFWIGSTLIDTFGWALWKPVAVCAHTLLIGSVVPLCHHVSVTGPLALAGWPEPPPPPPQAAASKVASTVTTSTPRVRVLRMSILSS